MMQRDRSLQAALIEIRIGPLGFFPQLLKEFVGRQVFSSIKQADGGGQCGRVPQN